MATKSKVEPQEVWGQFTGKAVEAFAIWAETNQRVLRELVDLAATTAKEGVRLYAELQSSAVEAMKGGQEYVLGRQTEWQEMQKDPIAWYQRSVLEGIEGTQSAFKLLEGNAQAITQSAERLQASAEQAGKEIQQTFASLGSRLKTLYTPSVN
jgi:prophage DNA circulation protein